MKRARYFVPDSANLGRSGDRRELVNVREVGVETADGAWFSLRAEEDGTVDLYGDDSFTISPWSSNHVGLVPRRDFVRNSRIAGVADENQDRISAQEALRAVEKMANEVTHADATRKAADREDLGKRLRELAGLIRRVL